MNGFVIAAGLLLAGVVVVLLRPLLRSRGQGADSGDTRALNLAVLRDQGADLERERNEGVIDAAAYARAREELERRALEDLANGAVRSVDATRRPRLALALGLVLPLAVVALYLALGQPQVFDGGTGKEAPAEGAHSLSQAQIVGMVERLSEKLQANPNDGAGWLMLARSYSVLGRFPESAAAYGRAAGLMPPDAQMFADYADTVAMAQGRKVQGEPEKLIRRALEIDPRNLKALALLGTIYFDRQDYASAIAEWQKVIALVPPESPVASGIQGSIRDAESRMAASGGAPAKVAAVADSSITGIVSIDPAHSGRFAPTDTVFVFARAERGPKMPLAILRKTVADLPLRFTLDDSMAMSPNFRLSQQPRVVVGARISKSGDAMPRAGDLQGLSAPMAPGGRDVRILIDSAVD